MGNIDDKGYWDSGCSRHITGNISYLFEYEPYDEGYVSFGQRGGKITSKGIIKTGKLEFENVYFVKELKHNPFSVSQICDNKNSVLFIDSECIVLGKDFQLKDDTNVLFKTPRQHNMYSIDLNNIVPHKNLTCLVTKALIDKSMLWHRRLSHLNFKTMNKLVRNNLVRGLPSKCFENDHTYVACLKGKQHKASCKTKLVNSISKPLHILHMDLFGPTYVSSLNPKWYCLVVTDDFSRFTWTFFVRTKDETNRILRNFITEIENLKDLKEELLQFKIQNVWILVDCPKREEGIDYEEVFAPVARIEAIRLFLAYTSFMGFIVYQMDVKSAFLYRTINEEVYVMQPPGFQDPEFPDRVYKALMHEKFQMSAMGELTFFLGLQVLQKKDGIFLSQDKYVGDILKKFGYSDVRSDNTPMDKENPWGKDGPGKDVELHLYRSMIRSLMYLTASRPDIMFAVCAYARHHVTPKECHLHTVKRIFRYLKGHPKLGLWYPKDSPFDLVAYSDNDYGGATQDRKLTTRGCQFLRRRLISWQCKKQTIMATSTTEAKYVAAASGCGQVLWIQNQMLDYGLLYYHNMIAILKKIEHNIDFHHIVDFLETSHLRESINKTFALPHESSPRVTSLNADEGSMQQRLQELMDLCTSLQRQQTQMAAKIKDQDLEISGLKARVKFLEDKDRGSAKPTQEDAPIKEGIMKTGDEVRADKSTELRSNDTDEMVNVLSSMEVVNILTSGVAAVSVSPVVDVSTAGVPTVSGSFPTVSSIFTTASVIDAQVAKEMEEEFARENQRVSEQLVRDSKIARLHAEKELKMMIEGLVRSNESKPLSKKEQMEFYIFVLRSHAGWKTRHFRGMTLEEIKEKFIPVWKQLEDFVPISSKEEGERVKRKRLKIDQGSSKRMKTSEDVSEEDLKGMMQLVPLEEVYVEALQVKHPIIDWEIHSEENREYWKIIRTLVKETLSIKQATKYKEKELWVELKRLFEPDFEDQLWTHNQALMYDLLKWKLYDICGVHHLFYKDQEIFMLIQLLGNRFKEANNKLSETNKLMYTDLKKFQAELDRRNDVKYTSKMEIDCAKAKGDLISYKMKSQKSFNKYTQTINDLNQTILEMKKELSAHQETISILSHTKEAQIKLYKTREDKELDKVIALENKVKVLDNIVFKTGQSVQTMNMLNSKCKTSFSKPEFLKKAQRANPRLYDIGCYNDNLALLLAPESDEVIRLEKESRSKLSDLIRPFDYDKLNNLHDLFVPQREKSSE
uniref:Putative ribonuclease H-like domain-containing protein n=1 Tax=Tanacetum cinerariifolium TaxID=118510 RepID=A0A6L2NX17_TANCI|nr:putative ribonuclease H-like domain-containing protein [Tanacetum cinerariifolium]